MMRIAILGGGISGLAIGWFLKQALGSHLQLTIIEKSQRPGGWIETLHKEGFLFEQGPRSCRSSGGGRETLALIEALGLDHEVIVPHSDAKKRYVYHAPATPAKKWELADHGRSLQSLPKKVWEIPFNSLTRNWLKVLWRDWWKPKRQQEDESIHSFFSRRVGSDWTENLIDPFVSGIYAGNCSRLSLKSCFPLFDEWELQQGSLLRGAWHHRSQAIEQSPFIQKIGKSSLFSFQRGMETFPRALAAQLKDHLLLGQTVQRLRFENQEVQIECSEGKSLCVDYVISTLPLFTLSGLLKDYPSLMTKLNQLSYATVTSINVGFHRAVLAYKGFGYLVPSRYGLPVLGCVWDSSIFPQQNLGDQTRLTIMMGGSRHLEVQEMSESELFEQAQRVLYEHLGIGAQPDMMQVKKASQAIPQFEVGHAKWKREIEEEIHQLVPQLMLSGSAWAGVSINDCVAQARRLAYIFRDKNS